MAIAVTTADVTDRNGALQMLQGSKGNLTEVKAVLLCDGGYSHPPKASYCVAPLRRTTAYCLQRRALSETFGGWLYTGKPFAEGVVAALGREVEVQIAKRSELHRFKVMPKRWVVERSFAWLEKNRRLWKNCERKLNTSLQFICLAFLG